MNQELRDTLKSLITKLEALDLEDKVEALNMVSSEIHAVSPFSAEPIGNVQWVPIDTVRSNDYNPNKVAPPEMELLRLSIANDGYTQPVVTWGVGDHREVVDGFHRTRVCRECDEVAARVSGFLPVVTIRDEQVGRNDRIASTIRHNRARGKHQVASMSDIVIELKKRNWSDKKVAKELGMDQDEVLRLCQISGLVEVFGDDSFSKAWDIGEQLEGLEMDLEFQDATDLS